MGRSLAARAAAFLAVSVPSAALVADRIDWAADDGCTLYSSPRSASSRTWSRPVSFRQSSAISSGVSVYGPEGNSAASPPAEPAQPGSVTTAARSSKTTARWGGTWRIHQLGFDHHYEKQGLSKAACRVRGGQMAACQRAVQAASIRSGRHTSGNAFDRGDHDDNPGENCSLRSGLRVHTGFRAGFLRSSSQGRRHGPH